MILSTEGQTAMIVDTRDVRLHEYVFARPFDSIDELVERITSEGPIGMRAAGRITATQSATCSRWATDGLLLPDDVTRMKLETIKSGGRLLASKAAILTFIAAQHKRTTGSTESGPRSPHARTVGSERAARELEAMGC